MTASDTRTWQLRDSEEIVTGNEALFGREHLLVAMTRVRNEALILPDTLDHLATQVDAIVAYDDASTDDSVAILRQHPKVALIVANRSWEADIEARRRAEGRHRGLLLDMARANLPHRWMFCFDPDERVTENVRSFVDGPVADACDAVRVKLFDAYITPEDREPYRSDRPLLHFRRFYGPEQRDILMLWRNHAGIGFAEGDGRTPRGMSDVKTDLTASITASRSRSSIGKRPATITSATFPTRPTARSGAPAKVRPFIPSRISRGRSMSGAKPCSPTPSRSERVSKKGRAGAVCSRPIHRGLEGSTRGDQSLSGPSGGPASGPGPSSCGGPASGREGGPKRCPGP